MKKAIYIILGVIGVFVLLTIVLHPAGSKKVAEQTITPTQEVLQIDIRVTNQTVKEINGKYRYFFDIRNHDSVPFSGSVKIELYNKNGDRVTYDSFNTNSTIKPDLGTSVYIDANTGPTSVHGEFSISSFKFEVKSNESVVATGEKTL